MQAIEAAAGTRLMLHAGGVADVQGRVVALVGPSGMGKTTASIYFARHGFGYVTDETVAIGTDGDVLPFPRPLSIHVDGVEVQRSPDRLGLAVPVADLRINRIVLLDRVSGHAERPIVNGVPLVDALLELIPHVSALTRLPEPLQYMARIVDQCGGAFRLTYGEMDDRVVDLISELLVHDADATDPWRALLPERRSTDRSELRRVGHTPDSQLFPGDVRDGVVSGDEALLLVDDVPVRLSAIGLAVWEAARSGVAESEIVSVVVRQHGNHPNAERIVGAAVAQMVTAGLLVTRPGRHPAAPAASR